MPIRKDLSSLSSAFLCNMQVPSEPPFIAKWEFVLRKLWTKILCLLLFDCGTNILKFLSNPGDFSLLIFIKLQVGESFNPLQSLTAGDNDGVLKETWLSGKESSRGVQTNYWDLKEGHGNKVVNMLTKLSAEAVNKLPLNLLSSNWLCQSLWLCGSQETVENSERDGNTRPPDLPLEKPVCWSGSNS